MTQADGRATSNPACLLKPMDSIYLDHNATSPLRPGVLEAMLPYLRGSFGNPSSQHRIGREAWNAVEEAREAVARLLGAQPSEIIFTSGGTEANHLAILGAVHAAHAAQKPENTVQKVLTSRVEHPAVLTACDLIEELGVPTHRLPVTSEGRIDLAALESALDTDGALVSLQAANHETGVLQPLEDTVRIAKEKRALVHSDIVQILGKRPVDVASLGIDLAGASAHKFGGPKGVGILVIRAHTPWSGWLRGSQEDGRRGGTPDVAAIVGAGVAAKLAKRELERAASDEGALREHLWKGLAEMPGARRFTPQREILPNTILTAFAGWDADRFVAALDRVGIAVSAGAACASGAGRPSPVMLAMGFDMDDARAAVRFSLGWNTKKSEIDEALVRIRRVLCAD